MAKMVYVVVVLHTIRKYAFVVRLDIQRFCSSSLSTNILGIGISKERASPTAAPIPSITSASF